MSAVLTLVIFVIAGVLSVTTINIFYTSSIYSIERIGRFPTLLNATTADATITRIVEVLYSKANEELKRVQKRVDDAKEDRHANKAESSPSHKPKWVMELELWNTQGPFMDVSTQVPRVKKTMDTLQLSLEKLDYELRNLPPPNHTFAMPPHRPLPLTMQQAAHMAKGNNTPFVAKSPPTSRNSLIVKFSVS